ncbi:MAG: co-chaperone GroES [Calditrichaceae bacterium]|nr:co-chaperone GroES [Calditrichaceae bacterium]MBN2710752.1 co-chaperone GroES [Calditrichaceae bacterium]RQV95703.1 MAG: co-chaperone GroES [Calditrichota bacterium]
MKNKKQIIVVGDRVLIKPDDSRERTSFGLYLPQGVETKEKVQGGYVVKVGPGYPLPDPNSMGDEPWDLSKSEPRYLPLQAEEDDYALFLRKAAIEIEFDREKYVIVSQAAILLLIRDNILHTLQEPEEE